MEKTIKIGDKEILLKATAMNLLIYQEEFGEDMFKAKGELLDAFKGDQEAIIRNVLEGNDTFGSAT